MMACLFSVCFCELNYTLSHFVWLISIFFGKQHSRMRQIVDDEHLRIYGIVARYIELVTVRRLLLLMDDVLTGRRFRQREYLQVVFLFDLHSQDHVPHKIGQPSRRASEIFDFRTFAFSFLAE